ncbi:MAG: glycosyltransferase [Pyrinomonadaceae bacterium]|nr:glycosyltransferase [Pyrinomonadaceae bacterium]
MIKLAFIIRSLDGGGAERQLVSLVKALDKTRFDVTVFTFYAGGMLEKELEGCDVRLINLGKRGRWHLLGFLYRFARHLRRLRPDVIHGYLDISNLLALSSRLFLSGPKIIWGARSSDRDLWHYDWLRRLSSRLERIFSRFADCIIVNSRVGREHLLKRGFPAEKLSVIHNGIDTEAFRPDPSARVKIRREWGIREDAILIGIVGRLDPVKDHQTFLRAASILHKQRPEVYFVCVGSGAASYRQRLEHLIEQQSLSGKIYWAGVRSDMHAVYNALDLHVSSSQSEGFSNAIGEAMACAVPCVVTDAGDSALIVGDTGFVSAPLDAGALASTLISCLESDRNALGVKARLRIKENWSVERLAERTEKLIAGLLEKN